MNYLITHLEGEAESLLKWPKLCKDNYEIAKDLLKEWFGHKQTLLSCHINKLHSLNNAYDSTDIKSLRKLFDTVEIRVRSLNCLSYNCHSYGAVLLPTLSQDWNLENSRKFRKNVLDIKLSIDTFRLETDVLGKVVSVGDTNSNSYFGFCKIEGYC